MSKSSANINAFRFVHSATLFLFARPAKGSILLPSHTSRLQCSYLFAKSKFKVNENQLQNH